jgi:hypothetical protein
MYLAGRVYYPWELHMSEDNVYRSLDRLIAKKDEMDIGIFSFLKPDTSVVHYDLMSSYSEGRENNEEEGEGQIVIGLIMADGIPIHHEVWPGNTMDSKTLESTISVLKDRFGIKNVTFIADRAFGRSGSLDLLDQNLYITAVYGWDQPYHRILMETDFTDGQLMDHLIMQKVATSMDDMMKLDSTEDQERTAEKRRYIAAYNKQREKLDLKDLNDKLAIVKGEMSEITDQKDLKRSMWKMKSLVKFLASGTTLN